MIGNEADARFIRGWRIEDGQHNNNSPEGWEYLGRGCYRAAYLHVASNVVYKVQHDYDYSYQTNAGEAAVLKHLFYNVRMPKGCRLPRFKFFEQGGSGGVLAMERFTTLLEDIGSYTDPEGYYSRVRPLGNVLNHPDGRRVCDLHNENLAIDEERKLLVPIDLAG